MRHTVNVAVVQFSPELLCAEANIDAMATCIQRQATTADTDLIVFPELATTGYLPNGYSHEFEQRLIGESDTIPGHATDRLGNAAREYGVFIVTGMSERHGELLHNTAVLISPGGEVVGIQRKVHLWEEEHHYFVAGDAFPVFDTALGRIGLSICYDSRFPESSRVQALLGAEILVCLFALAEGPELIHRVTLSHRAATRALENTAYYIACNRLGSEEVGDFRGGSAIAAPGGELLSVASGPETAIIRACLTASALAGARQYVNVHEDRRPEAYRGVIAPLAQPE